MDHIPLPQAPVCDHIEVPLYEYNDCCSYLYSSPWASYPKRQGFDFSDPKYFNRNLRAFPQELRKQLVVFAQSWLFFGVLDEFLGVTHEREDWVSTAPDGRRIITTLRLCERLEAWRTRTKQLTDDQELQVRTRIDRVLERMYDIHLTLSDPETGDLLAHDMADAFRYCDLLPEELNISIDILHATLVLARNAVFMQSPHPAKTYTKSRLLKSQLKNNGWCSSEVGRLEQDCSIVSTYYSSRLGPLEDRVNHSKCTSWRCDAWQVDHESYRTQHIDTQCDCVFINVFTEGIAAIIRTGHLPCLGLDSDGKTLKLCPIDQKGSTPFIAISHVWADGLGNPTTNALPNCQIRRIQERVNALSKAETATSLASNNQLFWMDTLCVPVGQAFETERNLAIAGMASVYKLASKVLIFNAELNDIDVNRSPWELSARINRTTWFRRLWTLHEGVLSKQSVFQFREGSAELSALHSAVESPGNSSSFKDLLCRVIFLETCQPFTKMNLFKSKPFPERVQDIWSAVQWRNTSYQEDETICLANMLGLDLTPILSISRYDPEAREKRMMAFVLMQKYFPQASVFESSHSGDPGDPDSDERPWLSAEGFKWAPRSFVFRTTAPDLTHLSSSLGLADERGLHASLPALNPDMSWKLFVRAIRRSAGAFGEFAEMFFILPMEWDYFYAVRWHPSYVKWELSDTLMEHTFPTIILQQDLAHIKMEHEIHSTNAHGHNSPIPRMFDEDLLMEDHITIDNYHPFSASTSAVIVAANVAECSTRSSPNMQAMSDPPVEFQARIIARVDVEKKMFDTYTRSAWSQVEGLNKLLARDMSVLMFSKWPDSTRWCIG